MIDPYECGMKMTIDIPNTCTKCETPEKRGPLLVFDFKTMTATCKDCGHVHKAKEGK